MVLPQVTASGVHRECKISLPRTWMKLGFSSLWRDSVSYMWRKFCVCWTEWVGIIIEKLILDTHGLIFYNFHISDIYLISRRQTVDINCSSYFTLTHEELFLCHQPFHHVWYLRTDQANMKWKAKAYR